MRAVSFEIVSLALVLAVTASPIEVDNRPVVQEYENGQQCPAKYFMLQCNACRCSDDGHSATCTKVYCPPGLVEIQQKLQEIEADNLADNEDDLPVIYELKKGEKCPAKKFKLDCNLCSCSEDGYTPACTLMACPPRPVAKVAEVDDEGLPVIYELKKGEKCPAQKFKLDCNYCACAEDGYTPACTLMACPPREEGKREKRVVDNKEIPVIHELKEGEKCPSELFKLDCNYCSCAKDGYTPMCTQMFCPKEVSEGKREKRAADDEEDIPVIYELKEGQKCPAQKFKLNCNYCSCAKDGYTPACTLVACPPVLAAQEKKAEQKVDVNDTSKWPVVHNYQFGQKCPAKFFKDDCNLCRCSKDGYSAACTLMACPPVKVVEKAAKKEDDDSDLPVVQEYTQGQKCPADRFKLKCNYCWCSKNGNEAACTRMAC